MNSGGLHSLSYGGHGSHERATDVPYTRSFYGQWQ